MMNKRLKDYFEEPNRNSANFYTKLMRFHLDNSYRKLFWAKYSSKQKIITSIAIIVFLVIIESVPNVILLCNQSFLALNNFLIYSITLILVGGWMILSTILLRPIYVKIRHRQEMQVYQKYYKAELGNKDFKDVSDDEIRKVNFIKLCNENSISLDRGKLSDLKESVEHYRDRNTYMPKILPQFVWILLSAIIAVLFTSGVSWLNDNTTNLYSFLSIVVAIIIMIAGFCIIIGQFVGGMEKKWWLSNRRQDHITIETIEQLIIESKE